jgi:pre-mRNA-processing factor SLU7
VIKGAPKAIVRSKYEEDIYHNNHSSIFGSFYDTRTRRWGYRCCHSTEKMSYCLGLEGKAGNEAVTSAMGKCGVWPGDKSIDNHACA